MKELLRRIGYDPKRVDTYVVLLSAPVLLTLYRTRGSARNLGDWFPGLSSDPLAGLTAVIFQWSAFFILVGLIPFLYARWRMGCKLPDLGWALGDLRLGSIVVALSLPLFVLPITYLSSHDPSIMAEYPLSRVLFTRPDLVIWYETAYVLLYYTAWEFYFRGFLLFRLEKSLGGVTAILIQTTSSCLVHIGKPESEILGSIAAGVIFGVLALRTRSFWYGWILHASVGVFVDLFILFR